MDVLFLRDLRGVGIAFTNIVIVKSPTEQMPDAVSSPVSRVKTAIASQRSVLESPSAYRASQIDWKEVEALPEDIRQELMR